MKKIFFLIFIITISIFGNSFPIMLEVKNDQNIPEDFRFGFAESLTNMGYSLIDAKAQEEALIEQREIRKNDCYDDCFADIGKKLAAKGVIIIDIKKRDEILTFLVRYIDFETGTLTKTLTRYYKDGLDNYEKLNEFGKNLSLEMFGKISDKSENKDLSIDINSKLSTIETAVKRYRLKTAKFPQSLDELTPEYLDRDDLIDPWGNKYVYELNGSSFKVFSKGLDNKQEMYIPEKLTKDQILEVIKSVAPAVSDCGKEAGVSGIVKVKFQVNGSGTVSNIEVDSAAGKATNCITSKIRGMRFARFTGAAFPVTFPFKI